MERQFTREIYKWSIDLPKLFKLTHHTNTYIVLTLIQVLFKDLYVY